MNKMKWMIAVAFGFISVTAFAQTSPAPAKEGHKTEQHKEHHKRKGHAGLWKEDIKEYEAQLKLTPGQVSQWEALNETSQKEINTLRNNTALAKEDKKAQMKTMREQKQTELQTILSEEQYARYKEIRKEKMQERKARGPRKAEWIRSK